MIEKYGMRKAKLEKSPSAHVRKVAGDACCQKGADSVIRAKGHGLAASQAQAVQIIAYWKHNYQPVDLLKTRNVMIY